MKIMGLDYGSKTVGVSMTDDLLMTAQPVETIRRDSENKLRKTLARVQELAEQNEVRKIVLGLPLLPDGTIGERAEKTLVFKTMLAKRTGVEIILVDERFTTDASDEELQEMGVRKQDRKQYVDQLAACHILEEYLHDPERCQEFLKALPDEYTDNTESEQNA